MARKGTKSGRSKAPAGVTGSYRPYSTALKLERLRREHEVGQSSNAGSHEQDMDTAEKDESRKGVALRPRQALQSPNAEGNATPRFKLDELQAVDASPEKGVRGEIQRSSTAGNGRRVSAAQSSGSGRNTSHAGAASLKRRRKSNNDEEGGDGEVGVGDETDLMAPLAQSVPTAARNEYQYSAPSTGLTAARKRRSHGDDSNGHPINKRIRYASPSPRQSSLPPPVNRVETTPQSSSRLSLGFATANEGIANRRVGHPDTFQGLDGSENGELRTDNPASLSLEQHSTALSKESEHRLERLLASFRSEILREVKDAQGAHAAQLKRLDMNFSESLQSIRVQLQDLSSVLQCRNIGMPSTASGGSSKTPLAEWEQKLEEMTPFKKEVFTSSVFARVLGYNLPLCVTQICAEVPLQNDRNGITRNIVELASNALATLLFSLKPNESREKNAEGIGKLHSDFKFSVIQNTFYNVQKNTFHQFKVTGSGGENDSASTVDHRGLLTQPVWLKPGFVSSTSILAARSFLENKQQAKRDKVKETQSRTDIAIHGAVKAYRYLTSHLHDGREKVKIMFFQDLGYLLVDWAGLISDVDQSELSLEWAEENHDSSDVQDVYFNQQDVPETAVARGSGNTNDADTKNRDILTDLYSRSKEMVLIAEHNVFVISGDSSRNKQRKHSGGVRRPIRRLINIIEVAANFCREFTQLPDIWAFLRSHTDSLRCIYAIAIVFRELTITFLSKASIPSGRFPSPSDVHVAGANLLQLLPGRGSRASLMASRCVRMVESEYETMNQPDVGTIMKPASAEPEYTTDIGAEIQASASLGVAAL